VLYVGKGVYVYVYVCVCVDELPSSEGAFKIIIYCLLEFIRRVLAVTER